MHPQASCIENKQDWIKHVREVIQERTIHLRGALKEPIHIPKAAATKHKGKRYVNKSHQSKSISMYESLDLRIC